MRWPPPKDWPNEELSRQIISTPHRWHVQESGSGKTIMLLHGAGGSTHSYRFLIPGLAERFHVVAIDLPGQGFSQLGARHRCSLQTMSEDLEKLCAHQGWQPHVLVGHSAGGALALDLSKRVLSPQGHAPKVVGINAALENFQGVAGTLFPAVAKILATVPFTASVFSSSTATPQRIKALIGSTGSKLDSTGLELYRRLVADRDHVDATLLMMAHWSLDQFLSKLHTITTETLLIVGELDGTVPPTVSMNALGRMQNARLVKLKNLGHLAHEEDPETVVRYILDFLEN